MRLAAARCMDHNKSREKKVNTHYFSEKNEDMDFFIFIFIKQNLALLMMKAQMAPAAAWTAQFHRGTCKAQP